MFDRGASMLVLASCSPVPFGGETGGERSAAQGRRCTAGKARPWVAASRSTRVYVTLPGPAGSAWYPTSSSLASPTSWPARRPGPPSTGRLVLRRDRSAWPHPATQARWARCRSTRAVWCRRVSLSGSSTCLALAVPGWSAAGRTDRPASVAPPAARSGRSVAPHVEQAVLGHSAATHPCGQALSLPQHGGHASRTVDTRPPFVT